MKISKTKACCVVVVVLCVAAAAVLVGLSERECAIAPEGVLIGTHNSVTGEEGYGLLSALSAPFSVCQSRTLAEQHAAGVRYFDLRVRRTPRGWVCAHGLWESLRTVEDILSQLSAYSNVMARVWYEGRAPAEFVDQVQSWKDRYGGIDIVQAGSRCPWRALRTWRNVQARHAYVGLGFPSWHALLPIPWFWKKLCHDQPQFDVAAYTVVDFL